MTMRIAFVVGEFPKLSETFILNQVTGLLKRGHEVAVYAARPGADGKVHPDVERCRLIEKVRYWPELTGRWTERLRLAGSIVARGGGRRQRREGLLQRLLNPRCCGSAGTGFCGAAHDAIVAHFGHVGLEALRLREAGALKGRLITFFHAYDMSVVLAERGERAYDRLFRLGELFLPVSRFWQQRLRELGCPPERTAVHRMGIDCARFSFSPRVPGIDGAIRLVSVARLVEKKGIAYALRALARVVCRHPAIEYTIIGDGPLRRELEALTGELQLSRHVRFAGWMGPDEIANALSRMHLFLAPSVTAIDSDVEGVPVALLEAMASGLPVLSTTHTGIPELVEDGTSGFLAPERNVDALAGHLCRLIETPASWPAMGRSGRARVEQEFDIEKLNDRLVERLEEVKAYQGRGGARP
jgi:colanic acid/amylovoran biosynthesis glycosyltransferase